MRLRGPQTQGGAKEHSSQQRLTAHASEGRKRPAARASEGGHRRSQSWATARTGPVHARVHASAGTSCARARAGASGGKTGVPPARGRTGVQDPRRTDERRAQQKRIAVHSQHCHAAHSTSAARCAQNLRVSFSIRSARRDGAGPVARERGRSFATARQCARRSRGAKMSCEWPDPRATRVRHARVQPSLYEGSTRSIRPGRGG